MERSRAIGCCLRNGDLALSAIIFLATSLVIGYCIWALDRGFAFRDEAYYLLLAIHPEEVQRYVSAQHWITGGIWDLTGSLVAFRAAGLLLLIASASVLAAGAVVSVAHASPGSCRSFGSRAVVVAASITSALLYASTINLSPSYNLLASAGAYGSAGLMLIAVHIEAPWVRRWTFVAAGAVLGMEFVSKPSAGLATLFLLITGVAILDRTTVRKVVGVAGILIGLAGCVLLLATTQTTIGNARTSLAQGVDLFKLVQTESEIARLTRYGEELVRSLGEIIETYWPVMLAVLMYVWFRRAVLVALLMVALGYAALSEQYYFGGADRLSVQMMFAFLLLILALLISFRTWRMNRPIAAVLVGLSVLPYTVALGTGNSLFTQVIVSLAPWGVALGVIAGLRFSDRTDGALAKIILVIFIGIVAAQVVSSGFRVPYDLALPLSEQSQSVEVADLGTVKVDAETKRSILAIQAAGRRCGVAAGTPFLGLYDLPGVALVLQGVPPVTPWLNNPEQANEVLRIDPSIASGPLAVAIVPSLYSLPSGLDAKKFRKCGAASPFVEIWSPRGQ